MDRRKAVKMETEAALGALMTHTVTLSTAVEKQGAKINQVLEAIKGNDDLGHVGIVQQTRAAMEAIEEQNKTIEEMNKAHLTFREQYNKEKAIAGKRWGILTGLAVVVGILGKAALVKLGILFI